MKKKKILIIDDEPDVVTFLITLLEDQGFETCAAQDGEEGWEKIQKERPDLICLDILMPRKTGIKLYRQVRQNQTLKCIPVVIITGLGPAQYADSEFKKFIYHRSIVPPPDGYLEKPIDTEVLLKTISAILEGQRYHKPGSNDQ